MHTAPHAGTPCGQGIQPADCALFIAPLLDFVEFRLHKILHQAGYGEVAQLSGIFSCAYPDAAQIPANLTGYAAIAQGMGIIGVEQEFAAGKSATRGEATEMLYNFMDR